MSRRALDRHLLASNATAWDTAWRSFGWTPRLAGTRASRLEEQVPWGTRSARLERPPRLSGPAEEVVDPANADRLGRALLPVDGRLGFSVWGAVGQERIGSEWRVATHTLLLDEDDFRAVAGHPEGLLAPDGRPAPWLRELAEEMDLGEPAPISPVVIDASEEFRRTLERARHAELRRLLGAALRARGSDRSEVAHRLAAVWEALAAVLGESSLRHVAVPEGEDGEGRTFLRLAWLALPLEDRLRTFFVTEQRRTEHPSGHLLGLPADEWGRYVPEGAWVAGISEPIAEPSPGRWHWARALVADDGLEAFAGMDRRAALRGSRLVAGDDLRGEAEQAAWLRRWHERGPSVGAVRELLRRERGRRSGPRLAAVGAALGRAAPAGVPDAVELLRPLDGGERERVLRGAVRRLLRDGRPAVAGLLRVRATGVLGKGGGALVDGLRRLVGREEEALRALLAHPRGPGELVLAAFGPAAAGDTVALELLRIGAAAGRWTAESGERLAGRIPLEDAGSGGEEVVAELLLTLVRDGASGRAVRGVAVPLLGRLSPSAAGPVAEGLAGLAVDGGTPGLEELRRATLLRVAAGGGRELDGAATALVELGARTAPPSERPATWRELVEEAPATWLGRAPVLDALVRALRAGERPLGDPGVSREVRAVASILARRVLGRAGPASLDPSGATTVLRLAWLEADGATFDWLVGTRSDAAAPLLVRMLAAPAPLPLVPPIRRALRRALDGAAADRGLDGTQEELHRWAPALGERVGRRTASPARLLPLRADGAGGPAGRGRAGSEAGRGTIR